MTIVSRARQKRTRLAKILDLRHGIPSHHGFNAISRAIEPDESERRRLGWTP